MKKVIEVATTVRADPHAIWTAMIASETPLFPDSRVETDWQVGHPIAFSGTWRGQPYRDRGEVREFEQDRKLTFAYWCDLDGTDTCQTVCYTLAPGGDGTEVRLCQYDHAERPIHPRHRVAFTRNWEATLRSLKEMVEKSATGGAGRVAV